MLIKMNEKEIIVDNVKVIELNRVIMKLINFCYSAVTENDIVFKKSDVEFNGWDIVIKEDKMYVRQGLSPKMIMFYVMKIVGEVSKKLDLIDLNDIYIIGG